MGWPRCGVGTQKAGEATAIFSVKTTKKLTATFALLCLGGGESEAPSCWLSCVDDK